MIIISPITLIRLMLLCSMWNKMRAFAFPLQVMRADCRCRVDTTQITPLLLQSCHPQKYRLFRKNITFLFSRMLSVQENQDDSSSGIESGKQDRWTPLSTTAKMILPFQLALTIYMLLLLPSGLALGTLCGARVMGTLPYEYLAFFSLLILPRSYRYGKFARPVSTNDDKKATSVVQVLIFILSLVGCHWKAAFDFARGSKSMVFPRTLFVVRLLAIILVAASGRALGKSYDRVTRPDALIQDGPYAIVRHPIYTAYMMLFASTLLTLRSYVPCLVLLGVSTVFYSARMDSEDEILSDAFGDEFQEYKKRVPWRMVPFIF